MRSCLLLSVTLASSVVSARPPVLVEHVTEKPQRTGRLGTTSYSPSQAETAFVAKVAEAEQVTGGMSVNYDLSAKSGVYVGWFGIVRAVKEEKGSTTLTVEHKGFDGLTDAHILAIDFNGGGDFVVRVPGVGHKIEKLTLVKVYGTAKVANGAAELEAEFVRNWHWGTFTFIMAAGRQHGSERWRKLNTVALDEIYDPYPNDTYYEARLGKR